MLLILEELVYMHIYYICMISPAVSQNEICIRLLNFNEKEIEIYINIKSLLSTDHLYIFMQIYTCVYD